MPGYGNMYDIYDLDNQKFILRNATAGLVEQTIGLGRVSVSTYANKGLIFKKRYRIYSKEQPVKSEIRRSKEIQKLMEEWDRVRFMINPNAKR